MKHTYEFKNGDVIEMKAIKRSEFASEETHCYEAKIYLNGKQFCEVSNHGRGASDDQHPLGDYTYKDVRALDQRCRNEMPKWSMLDDTEHHTNLEMWCGDQINKWLAFKDMTRLMKSKVLMVDGDGISTFGYKGVKKLDARHLIHAERAYPKDIILNTLPVDQAFDIFYEKT